MRASLWGSRSKVSELAHSCRLGVIGVSGTLLSIQVLSKGVRAVDLRVSHHRRIANANVFQTSKCSRFIAGIFVVWGLLLSGPLRAVPTPPNIVVIMGDDMAWSGTSVQMDPNNPNSKSDYYRTPVLEQMAQQGMTFSHAYGAGPICSPSRAALQTGKSPAQLRVTDVRNGGKFTDTQFLNFYNGQPLTAPMPRVNFVNPTETIIPEMLKALDSRYRSALYGKEDWWPNPLTEGYDSYSSFLPVNTDQNDPADIFGITAAANSFMETQVQANRPFFTLLAHYAPKLPLPTVATQASLNFFQNIPPGQRHNELSFAAVTKDIDTSVGLVLDKITQLGIQDNTYVIFVSDQGAAPDLGNPLANAPLTGGKGTLFEGGVRVPLIIKGPGITPNSNSSVPVTITDFFPTFYELAGGTNPLPSNVEGTSFASILHNSGQIPQGESSLQRALGQTGNSFSIIPTTVPLSRPGGFVLPRQSSTATSNSFAITEKTANPISCCFSILLRTSTKRWTQLPL